MQHEFLYINGIKSQVRLYFYVVILTDRVTYTKAPNLRVAKQLAFEQFGRRVKQVRRQPSVRRYEP